MRRQNVETSLLWLISCRSKRFPLFRRWIETPEVVITRERAHICTAPSTPEPQSPFRSHHSRANSRSWPDALSIFRCADDAFRSVYRYRAPTQLPFKLARYTPRLSAHVPGSTFLSARSREYLMPQGCEAVVLLQRGRRNLQGRQGNEMTGCIH